MELPLSPSGSRSQRLFISLLVMAAISAEAAPAQAVPQGTGASVQDQVQPSLNMVCWRGAPRPACGGFVVVEMQGVMPLVQTRRTQTNFGRESFDSHLEWSLGYMGNVSSLWAVGGTLSMGTGADGILTGLRARARRWLGAQRSIELEGGMFRRQAFFAPGDLTGASVGVRFNVGDRGSLFARWDGVDEPPLIRPTLPNEPGGFRQALLVGVGTGSTWALGTTAALGVGYLLLIAVLLGSGYD